MQARLPERHGPERGSLREIPRSDYGSGQVAVRTLAASVNRVDPCLRNTGAGITHELLRIMEADSVDEVAEAPVGCRALPGRALVHIADPA